MELAVVLTSTWTNTNGCIELIGPGVDSQLRTSEIQDGASLLIAIYLYHEPYRKETFDQTTTDGLQLHNNVLTKTYINESATAGDDFC